MPTTTNRFRLAASLTLALGAVFATAPASAVTLYSDDFESYAAGSDLIGQGGWASGFAGSVAPVSNGTYLPSKVLDGRTALGAGQINVVSRAIGSLDASLVTMLSVDAYATTDRSTTHNMAIFLTDRPDIGFTAAAGWFADHTGPGWKFTVNCCDVFDTAGGYDMPVKMSLVIDGAANEAWGTYDFGAGMLETPHYAVSDVYIASLDSLLAFIDHRGGTRGMEIDNLVLADNTRPIPEPSTLALSGLGIALVVLTSRQRRRVNTVTQPPRSNS